MRKLIFLFFTFLLIAGCTPPAEEIDIAKEEETVKQVVQSALDAIVARDYDVYVATWVHSPYVERRGIVGWDSLSVFYQNNWNNPPEYFQARVFTASNFDIYINGNFASVFHDEHFEGISDGEELVRDSRGVHKYLEKIDGDWKVITLF